MLEAGINLLPTSAILDLIEHPGPELCLVGLASVLSVLNGVLSVLHSCENCRIRCLLDVSQVVLLLITV